MPFATSLDVRTALDFLVGDFRAQSIVVHVELFQSRHILERVRGQWARQSILTKAQPLQVLSKSRQTQRGQTFRGEAHVAEM